MKASNLIVGKVSGIYGVVGWIKVFSYTRPRENIFQYPLWLIGNQSYEVLETRKQAKVLVAKLAGIDDRDHARQLMGQEISVERKALASPEEGEYYWVDLIGLQVKHSRSEFDFGQITGLMETGSNDVLVVKGEIERLIPFIQEQVIKKIDLEAGTMWVDWDPEF